jgi:hypothetical protein
VQFIELRRPQSYRGAAANNNCVNGGINCTPQQLAANDLFVWNLQVVNALPVASWTVTGSGATAPFDYVITVNWSEPTQAAQLSFVLNFQI